MAGVENTTNVVTADWRYRVRLLVGATVGFLTAIFVGVASADEPPTSAPVEPDVALAPAVVVSVGANAINTNAVTQITALSEVGTEYGTGVRLDDGRIGTVAHALVDARSVGIEGPLQTTYGSLLGETGIDFAIDETHDLAAFRMESALETMPIASADVVVGDHVALAGFGRDERLVVVAGEVLYRGPGAAYGLARPDIIVVGASVQEGWSGGPVANTEGAIVGLIVGMERVSGVAVAVPVEHLPALEPAQS